MKISEFKNLLTSIDKLVFELPDQKIIPQHFHVTEVGVVSKHFVDCGGTIRKDKTASFQIWVAADLDHRLSPEKLLKIVDISKNILGDEDLDIEVEYQVNTINKFGLDFKGGKFMLTPTFTDCLARDHCGIPTVKYKLELADLGKSNACCTPGTCC
ncbi:MAG: DUF6428 family protein [Saprospiraceae bacterium]